jgi:Mrp family chromosome partitioning ATPase
VLLVDTDMRRANLGKYLHSKSQQGLTDYLAGNALNWGNAIEYTNHFPLLHILKAGTTSSNPNELLKSDRFKDFIDEARAAYDCVILDSPPAGLAPDAFVVAEYVDMTLFVVREKLTSKAAAAFLDDDKYLQLNNLHLVYNGMTAPEYGSGHSGSF